MSRLARCRGCNRGHWRDPIENLRTAIVAVGPQQDLGVRPVSADRAQQAPQEGLDLLAARPLGGTKHGGDEAAFAVEHDDRLKSVFVVVGVEQPQLLTTVDRIDVSSMSSVIRLEPWRRTRNTDRPSPCPSAARRERPAILQPRYCRLRAQLPIDGRKIQRHLEHRIAAQRIGVVAVLVAGADHQQSKTDDVRQAVRDLIGRARIDHAGGEPIGDPKPLFDFAQRQNAAIRRQQAAVKFDHDRLAGSG